MRRVRDRLSATLGSRARLPRPLPALAVTVAATGVSLFAAACGSNQITVPKSDPNYQGAVIFNQHCSGCHSLSAAATYGSASNVRTREYTNGPNFNVRCERPLARILYAIANGGFSGAIMPQNIVVGQDAIKVAEFIAKYSGSAAPAVTGVQPCAQRPLGQVPPFETTSGSSGAAAGSSGSSSAGSSGSSTSAAGTSGSSTSGAGTSGASTSGAGTSGASTAGAGSSGSTTTGG